MNDGMSVARRTAAPAKAGQVLWLKVSVALLLIVVAAAALLSISRDLNASRASYADVLHTRATLDQMFARGKAAGIETRGVSDHGFIDSIYFRDPNGYVIELTTKTADDHEDLDRNRARRVLDEWQQGKASA